MKVLVLGGTQFNGYHLVKELIRCGHEVTILNRGKTHANLPRSVKRLVCDRTDHDAMRAVLGGHEWDCVHDMTAYQPSDVELMTEILDGRTGHYVFASSTVIYATSNALPFTESHPVDRSSGQNQYGLNKLLCEDHLLKVHHERGFPATIAAFSMVFGPRNILPDREQRMFMRLLQKRKVMIPGDGTTVGQVGHVEDEARALRIVMQNPRTFGQRYNLTGGDCYTDEGYVDTFAAVLGLEPQKVFIPHAVMEDLWDGSLTLGGAVVRANVDIRTTEREDRAMARFRFNLILQRIAPHLHHWNRSVFFSMERLHEHTGWRPEYSFRGAVEQTWDWMQSEGLDRSLDFDFSFEDDLLAEIDRRHQG